MEAIRIADNSSRSLEELKVNIKDLEELAKINIEKICNSEFLFHSKNESSGKRGIFSLDDGTLTTYNIMGFIGKNNSQFTITSRFSEDDERDYFLHYMLQKVFSIHLFDVDQKTHKDSIWDFLIYFFPNYLKQAYSQGIFKAYKETEYNDTNIKGTIDVKRHIEKNLPFSGKIAYKIREHSYNNYLTQLIRHTIEYIKTHPFGSNILHSDNEMRDIVSKFIFITERTYNRRDRQKIISLNIKPTNHAYFTKYKDLQRLCLRILLQDKISYGQDKNNIYGLLFDGAWLWEEYLNTLLKDNGFNHPDNRKQKNSILIFADRKDFKRYPDFYKKDIMILDAKYKPIDKENDKSKNNSEDTDYNINRNDINQIVSYMYILKSKIGELIYPCKDFNKPKKLGQLNGYGNEVHLFGLGIPQNQKNFSAFRESIKKNEEGFIGKLEELINNISAINI